MPDYPQDLTGNYGSISTLGSNPVVIKFPCLPNEIPLSRESEFEVYSNQALPDGISLYQKTNQLEIPLSFSLHYTDCSEGAQTMLFLGAQLHALTLPVTNPNSAANNQAPPKVETDQNASLADKIKNTAKAGVALAGSTITYPPACRLSLLSGDGGIYGIDCVGYVKSVKFTPKGPWMQGSRNSMFFNLPTTCDYEINFVHCPGYTNDINDVGNISAINAQAFGPDVYNRFYNTFPLSKGNLAYVELGSLNQKYISKA